MIFIHRVEHTSPDKECDRNYKARTTNKFFVQNLRRVVESWPALEGLIVRHFKRATVNYLCDHVLFELEERILSVFGGCKIASGKDAADGLLDRILNKLVIFSRCDASLVNVTFTWSGNLSFCYLS